MKERSGNPRPETNDLFPPMPNPGPAPPNVPGPIPWIAEGTAQSPSSRARAKVLALLQERRPTTQAAGPFMSCFWCERLHRGAHPLSVCPVCTAKFATMRSLEMRGSYPLSDEAIDEALTRTAPGNYALGYLDGEAFRVFYVGRSDSDLNQRLHEWVDRPSQYEAHASQAKAPWGTHRRGPLPLGAPSLDRVGCAESSYTRFAYSYATSADDAYAKEWRNYDAFGGSRGLDNEAQPVSVAE